MEYEWNVTVDGQIHLVTCQLQGNKYVLYCGDDHVANVYHSVGKDTAEPVLLAGKECLFVVWDERPDLVMDGVFLDKKTNYAEALKARQKGFRLTYRIIIWCGIAILVLTAGYHLLNMGKELDVHDMRFYAIAGLFMVIYGIGKTRRLTHPPQRSIMSEDKTKGAK